MSDRAMPPLPPPDWLGENEYETFYGYNVVMVREYVDRVLLECAEYLVDKYPEIREQVEDMLTAYRVRDTLCDT